MTLTPSTMLSLGTYAPEFSLPDVTSGKSVSLQDFKDKKALLVIFLCRHCPYVQHVKGELSKLGAAYKERGVGIVGISANDVDAYPSDAPDSLAVFVKEEGFSFPILFDETQEVAKAYTAACTPDFFLFNESRKLVYRGQLDDSRPSNGKPLTGRDVCSAIDAVIADQPISPDQKPSIGCNIKWKAGNVPVYAGGSS